MVQGDDASGQPEASYEKASKMLDSAGISSIGKEILLSCLVEKQSVTEVSERLGLSVYQVRTIKKRAITLAQRHPEAFGILPMNTGILSGNIAPDGETQWLQSLSSAK